MFLPLSHFPFGLVFSWLSHILFPWLPGRPAFKRRSRECLRKGMVVRTPCWKVVDESSNPIWVMGCAITLFSHSLGQCTSHHPPLSKVVACLFSDQTFRDLHIPYICLVDPILLQRHRSFEHAHMGSTGQVQLPK